jgi:hypothetical protein
MKKITDLKVVVKTKSNYKGLNGQILKVKEILNTTIVCLVFLEELQKEVTVDFNIKEIVKFI